MKKRYIVQEVEGLDGIELASDPPVGRRIYRPGDVIELDDAVHKAGELLRRGQIAEEPAPVVIEDAAETEAAPRASRGKVG